MLMCINLKAEKETETKGRNLVRDMATALPINKNGEYFKRGYLNSFPPMKRALVSYSRKGARGSGVAKGVTGF